MLLLLRRIEVSVEIRAILRRLPLIDPKKDNRKMVQKE